MATSQSKLDIIIDLQRKNETALIELNKELKNTKEAEKEVKQSSESMTGSFIKAQISVEALKKIANTTVGALKELGAQFVELAQLGGKFEDVNIGFKKNFDNSTKALNDLRKASNGTINDLDLMLNANKAALLGVTSNSEELAKLLEIARGRAQQLGIDATQAFQDIVTGIGRNSPLILDNLGITTKAYNEQIETLRKQGIVLSDTEQKQLLLNTVLADTSRAVPSTTTSFEQFRTVIDNLRLRLADFAQNIFDKIYPGIQMLGQAAKAWIGDVFTQIKPSIDQIVTSFKEIYKTAQEEGLITTIKEVGVSLSGSFADYIVQLVKNLAGAIQDFTAWIKSEDGKQTIDTLEQSMRLVASAVGTTVDNFVKLSNWYNTNKDRLNSLAESLRNIMKYTPAGIIGEGIKNLTSGKANGGIVGGSSYSGDRLLTPINSGEMVLNKGQQANLFRMIQGGQGGGVTVNVTGNTIDSQSRINDLVRSIKDALAQDNMNARLGLSQSYM